MNQTEWENCTNPVPMLEFWGNRMSDLQLKQFSVACYWQIQHYLSDEAKQVVEAVEAEVNGNPDPAAFVSACNALESDVFDASTNTLDGIVSNYVIVLTEPPALEGAQSAINAVKRVAEWTAGSDSDRADARETALAILAGKLRHIADDSFQSSALSQ